MFLICLMYLLDDIIYIKLNITNNFSSCIKIKWTKALTICDKIMPLALLLGVNVKKISEENSNNSKNLIKSFHSILLYGFVKAKSSFHKLKNLFRSILKSILRYLKLSLSK